MRQRKDGRLLHLREQILLQARISHASETETQVLQQLRSTFQIINIIWFRVQRLNVSGFYFLFNLYVSLICDYCLYIFYVGSPEFYSYFDATQHVVLDKADR